MQTFLRLGLAVAALSSAVATVPALAADAYPNKPVQMVIGFPPGSATDFVGRLIAPKLAERLGQPVVVENRPGAAGVLATASFAKAKPDGYSIMVSIPGPITIAPITQKGNLRMPSARAPWRPCCVPRQPSSSPPCPGLPS